MKKAFGVVAEGQLTAIHTYTDNVLDKKRVTLGVSTLLALAGEELLRGAMREQRKVQIHISWEEPETLEEKVTRLEAEVKDLRARSGVPAVYRGLAPYTLVGSWPPGSSR